MNYTSKQPEITDEQAIEHLQSTGWMQNHDREMYDMGLKKQLADDSGSYDSLLPTAEPSFNKDKVSNLLYHIYSICSPHTNAMAVAARNFYFEELGKELFGDDIPVWMQR